jgi:DNA repair protein RadD
VASYETEARNLRAELSNYFALGPEEEPETFADIATGPRHNRVLVRSELRPTLFGYQEELATEALRVLNQADRGLLALPTGAGKTRTAVAAVLEFLAEGHKRVVWLAPSKELVNQAVDTFGEMWLHNGSAPDLQLAQRSQPFLKEDATGVWLTTPQAVHASVRAQIGSGSWDAVVFDEAHQLGARTFRNAVDGLLGDGARVGLLGLSATPGRFSDLETEELVDYFERRLITSRSLKADPVGILQRWGILSRLKFQMVVRNGVRLDGIERLRTTTLLCERLSLQGRRVLVFTASVAEAVVLAEAIRSRGRNALDVHSGLSDVERDRRISAFGSGKAQVMTNQRLLATGYDCPAVSDVVLTSKVGSPILFEQMVGRAARGPQTGGDPKATVWQFDDHLAVHGLPQSYYRYRDFEWR